MHTGKLFLLLALFFHGAAWAEFEEDYETKRWQEIEVQLPAAPQQSGLQAIYVSAATDNRFFVDLPTVNVGSDGVVRYVLVVATPGGARNVSFEGIRCLTRERRIYATGRTDGHWSKSRNNEWTKIREEVSNRVHAALFLEYFCPDAIIVRNTAEAQDALRRGGFPGTRLP